MHLSGLIFDVHLMLDRLAVRRMDCQLVVNEICCCFTVVDDFGTAAVTAAVLAVEATYLKQTLEAQGGSSREIDESPERGQLMKAIGQRER